jgi:hypothetical protein
VVLSREFSFVVLLRFRVLVAVLAAGRLSRFLAAEAAFPETFFSSAAFFAAAAVAARACCTTRMAAAARSSDQKPSPP